MPRLEPGDKAPDFTIKDLEGKQHRLYDYLNGQKTLLLFYRGEWCPICNIQLKSLQDELTEFQKENAQIVAVSTDTPENSQKLVGKHNLGFPVLAGLGREMVEAYGLFFNEKKAMLNRLYLYCAQTVPWPTSVCKADHWAAPVTMTC